MLMYQGRDLKQLSTGPGFILRCLPELTASLWVRPIENAGRQTLLCPVLKMEL